MEESIKFCNASDRAYLKQKDTFSFDLKITSSEGFLEGCMYMTGNDLKEGLFYDLSTNYASAVFSFLGYSKISNNPVFKMVQIGARIRLGSLFNPSVPVYLVSRDPSNSSAYGISLPYYIGRLSNPILCFADTHLTSSKNQFPKMNWGQVGELYDSLDECISYKNAMGVMINCDYVMEVRFIKEQLISMNVVHRYSMAPEFSNINL